MFDNTTDEENDQTQTQEAPNQEAASAEDAPPSVFDWNGELDALTKADWFSRIEEPVRNTLVRGVENKYKNFERGFTKAFQDTAGRKRELDRKEAALREQELKIQKWLTGDADPMAEKQAEIDRLKAMHDAALGALRDEFEQAQRKASEEWTGKYGTAERERDELRLKLESFEYEARQAEERQVEAAVDEVENWMKSEAADVYENDDAFYAFSVLVTGGIDPEDAVSMVRAKFAPPAPPEPEAVPDAMELMNMGPGRTASTAATDNRSYKDIMDSMRRLAQADEAQFYNPRR
jgi:hypothetical protein